MIMMAAFEWIYFLVLAIIAFEQVRGAQLRLVNGLFIIEDRPPIEESSSSRNVNITTTISRSDVRENRNNDLHGHGYLNRNRSNSLRSSRRMLKDEQGTTTTKMPRHNIIDAITQNPPTAASPMGNSIEPHVESEVVTAFIQQQTTIPTIQLKDPPVTGQENLVDKSDSKDQPIETKTLKQNAAANSVTSPTMDVITIVWYFSTFIALVAFFVVMVCSDKYCTRGSAKPEESVTQAPATPAPSYREFAPPSYDSVMKKYHGRALILPMLNQSGDLKLPDESMTPAPPLTAIVAVIQSQTHVVQVEVPAQGSVDCKEDNAA